MPNWNHIKNIGFVDEIIYKIDKYYRDNCSSEKLAQLVWFNILEFHPELWTSLFQNKNVEKSGYAVLSKSWENNKGGIFYKCGGFLTNISQSVDEISILQIILYLFNLSSSQKLILLVFQYSFVDIFLDSFENIHENLIYFL